jgi:beta-galactosidase
MALRINIKISLIGALLSIMVGPLSLAQERTPVNSGKSLMPAGAYYYPEHWPQNQWARDLRKMAELGFSFTHMAEFAWSNLEPEEGKYNFEWLDECIEEAAKNGLHVILCTPTACPPAWLTAKHPGILLVNDNDITLQHGGNRLHVNQENPVFREYAGKIVTAMAKRYGHDPRVIGWQIDNEPHLASLYDYSDFAAGDFRRWLIRKYDGNIDSLNRSWGNAFWSGSYNNFEQVQVPNEKKGSSNPHALLDFRRYTADALAGSIRFQAEILRQYSGRDKWITTNFAYYKFLSPVDLFRSRDDLDFASHTMYLLNTYLNYPEGDLNFRLGSGMELSFSGELAKSIKGYTGIMELQPGQINWGSYNAQPLPGAVRMWIWHCFGLGEKFVCTYRFRQPLFGSEQTHKGIIETDGVTVSRGGMEYARAISEINKLSSITGVNTNLPRCVASRRTAFLWKQDNIWEMEVMPHTRSWDTWQHYYTYYENLKKMGVPVTFITADSDFDPEKFPFMVAPAFTMTDPALIKKWEKYVSSGGNLFLSCRTGQKDNDGHFHETLLQEPVWDLIGARIEDNDQLPPGRFGSIKGFNREFRWNVWGEIITPGEGTEVLATYSDQFYSGKAAAVTRKIGKGTVTYAGAWSLRGELERQILREIYKRAGADILDLPDYVFVEWRDGFNVAVNYTSEPYTLDIPVKSRIINGERLLKPGEVTVWIK